MGDGDIKSCPFITSHKVPSGSNLKTSIAVLGGICKSFFINQMCKQKLLFFDFDAQHSSCILNSIIFESFFW
jgi:hypothetical protein